MSDSAHSPSPKLPSGLTRMLAIDTCGPTGSVALGELVQIGPNQGELRILGETELAGRTYSATLVAAVGELLSRARIGVSLLDAIVVVNGPGSFTGVRVGLSAVKGLAEGGDGIPVVAVSRLEVLASKAGVPSAALDAHRGEIFLRVAVDGVEGRELLAGAQELAAISPRPIQIAVCDESAAALLSAAWPAIDIMHVSAPTASEALDHCLPRVAKGERAELALLDGHYLRRSDAEIFGDPTSPKTPTNPEPRRP